MPVKSRKGNREIEIKLRVADISALRLRLKRLRAREICPRTRESNTIYDNASKSLTARSQFVRIRIEHPAPIGKRKLRKAAGNAVITYKGPIQSPGPVRSAPGKKSRYKIREEVEVVLGNKEQDAAAMTRILLALGLRPVFQYEKFRTTYILPGIRDLKIELDETPVGLFLELEGPEPAIDCAAKLLGYTPRDYIARSYGALYIAACRRRGLKPGNMLFVSTKKCVNTHSLLDKDFNSVYLL
jgi:adenylate cyclase class 2